MEIRRREFLRWGTAGLAALSLKAIGSPRTSGSSSSSSAQAAGTQVTMSIGEALFEMVDGQLVYMWAFEDPVEGPLVPGPVLEAVEGEPIQLTLTNTLGQPHAFQILGTPINLGPIDPGQSMVVNFNAPAAGTYLYLDPLNAPVNRLMGLHGAMVVLPPAATTVPYTSPAPNVLRLFADLGTASHFPGEPWNPARTRTWLLHSVDPIFNGAVQNGQSGNVARFLPRYFTINGLSGAFASHDEFAFNTDENRKIVARGRIGQPYLIRILNAGTATHSIHFHANHVYILSLNNVTQDNVFHVDTFTVAPLDRVDMLLPFVRPPHIPGDPAIPLRQLIPNELALVLDAPQSPLEYPMHCHMEMSQTAAGGNYPQGLTAHWALTGDVDGVDFPNAQCTCMTPGPASI